jgi:hypothetical protein
MWQQHLLSSLSAAGSQLLTAAWVDAGVATAVVFSRV